MDLMELYQNVSREIFLAYRHYFEYDPIVILAADKDEALELAKKHFNSIFISVEKLEPTENLQVFKPTGV